MPNVWSDILERIEAKVNRHSFQTWFKPSRFVAQEGSSVIVRVPNGLAKDWLTNNYDGIIAEALKDLQQEGMEVRFVTDDHRAATYSDTPESESPAAPDPVAAGPMRLNSRYTFDSFVVGSSNQFAHAAALAVAEAPFRSYNPLYLYGGVGLGKTHLMHAIGRYLLEQMPDLRLTYITSERFMNEMINALRFDRSLEFRERFRNVDILLLDDVQFLAGKEGTQTEFFHTFNSLYDAQKQIVISSDCPPNEIPALEERLRSRFEWGLIADIQPPDLETKVAIIKKKVDFEAVPLPDDVALYIAGRIKSNIREIEGALIRLIAFASLNGKDITLELARDTLSDILGRDDKEVTIEQIQKFVADHYHLRVADLKSRNQAKAVAEPRQIAIYLAKCLTKQSLPQIGKSFDKHHSTVIHSINKIEEQRKQDRDFNKLVTGFLRSFN